MDMILTIGILNYKSAEIKHILFHSHLSSENEIFISSTNFQNISK
jgi:hypothetical protein